MYQTSYEQSWLVSAAKLIWPTLVSLAEQSGLNAKIGNYNIVEFASEYKCTADGKTWASCDENCEGCEFFDCTVLGHYDETTHTAYVNADISARSQILTLAHELMHFIQHTNDPCSYKKNYAEECFRVGYAESRYEIQARAAEKAVAELLDAGKVFMVL